MIVLNESLGGMRVCDMKERSATDRRRKISYAIQEPEISRRRKHRMPQIVGLAFFLVLASVITVGLVFGIGNSEENAKNATSHNFRNKVTVGADIVNGPVEMKGEFSNPPSPLPTVDANTTSSGKEEGYETVQEGAEEVVDEEEEIKQPETCEGKEQKYRFSTVNSNSELCSQHGLTVVGRHHGSAVDAALATMLCMGVVHPHSSGLGGGFFMLVYQRENRTTHALDARVSAPSRATRYMFEQKLQAAKQGFLSVATPGEVHGFWTAHQKFGKLPWRDLFKPAIKLASDGFPVSKTLSAAINSNRFKVHKNAELKNLYIDRKTGNPVRPGETVTNAPLANTLTLLANHGLDEFYNGSITQNIVLDLVREGGSLSIEDLVNYKSRWRKPVTTALRNATYELQTMPLPASGVLLTLVANIMDGYYGKQNVSNTELGYHRLIESVKFAMARKLYLGDPDFLKKEAFIEGLETKAYALKLRDRITNVTHDPMYYGELKSVSDQGTSVVIVMHPSGDVVVATSSLGAGFGSGIYGKYTGIVYNNAMKDFDLPQTPPTFTIIPPDSNFIQASKRPMSSMSPCIILDNNGEAVIAMGAGGGPEGLSALALTIMRTLYMNQTLKDAIDSPFMHNEWLPPFTKFEPSLDEGIVQGLRRRGHLMSGRQSSAFVNAVQLRNQSVHSYADPRKGGCVDGY